MAQQLARGNTRIARETAQANLKDMKLKHRVTMQQGTAAPTQQLDRPTTNFKEDPKHYPDVPKPPRPPGCRRGYHATILGCGWGFGVNANPKRGFQGNFYRTDGLLSALPDFSTLIAEWTDVPHEIDYDLDRFSAIADTFLGDQFAARWEGMFKIEMAGEYTFYAQSDQGSKVNIDTVGDGNDYSLIVDNDGENYAGGCVKTGVVALQKGWHPILVDYFAADEPGQMIKIKYSGPDTDDYRDYVEGYHLPPPPPPPSPGPPPPPLPPPPPPPPAPGPAWPLSYWQVAGAGVDVGAMCVCANNI